MAECYIIDSPNVALTAGTAKSVLVAVAASTQPFRVVYVNVGCDATAAGLLKIEFLVATKTGGTTGTAPTIARMNGEGFNKAALTTAVMYTAEPTYTANSNNSVVNVNTIMYPLPATAHIVEYPLGREFYCPESNVFAIRLTSTTVSPNSYSTVAIEE